MSLEDVARLHGYRWERTFERYGATYHWKNVGLKVHWCEERIVLLHGDEVTLDERVVRAGDPMEAFYPEFEDAEGWRDFRTGSTEWLRAYSLDGGRTCARFTYPLERIHPVREEPEDNQSSVLMAEEHQRRLIERILGSEVPLLVRVNGIEFGAARADVERHLGSPFFESALGSGVRRCDYEDVCISYAECGRALILRGKKLQVDTWHFAAGDPLLWIEERFELSRGRVFRVAPGWKLRVAGQGALCSEFEFPSLSLVL